MKWPSNEREAMLSNEGREILSSIFIPGIKISQSSAILCLLGYLSLGQLGVRLDSRAMLNILISRLGILHRDQRMMFHIPFLKFLD